MTGRKLGKPASSFSFIGVAGTSSRVNSIITMISSQSIFLSRRLVRNLSGSTALTANNSSGSGKRINPLIKWLVLVIKLVRIPILLLGVYSIGQNQAVIDYSRNPNAMRQDICLKLLKGMGAADSSQVQVMGEDSLPQIKSEGEIAIDGSDRSGYGPDANREIQLINFAGVSQRIVKSAKGYVAAELKRQVKAQNDQNDYDEYEEYSRWKMAHERLGMQSGINWSFVLVNVETPKVLISEYLPNTIFITRGLLDGYISNEHELSLILAHAISLLIEGEESEENYVKKFLEIVEILILAVDPTEGFLSIFVMASIALIKNYLLAGLRWENEQQADRLGMKLAAMACFDTQKSTQVMQKLHNATEMSKCPLSQTTSYRPGVFQKEEYSNQDTILYTEKSFLDRHKYLDEISETENANKYASSHCRHLKVQFFKAWALSKGYNLVRRRQKGS